MRTNATCYRWAQSAVSLDNFKKRLKSAEWDADTRSVGDYEEMSTARLTWVVLDRLAPPDEEAIARAALIARDPQLQNLVTQGTITEAQAIATIRAREPRHRDPDQSTIWASPGAAVIVVLLLVFLVVGLLL